MKGIINDKLVKEMSKSVVAKDDIVYVGYDKLTSVVGKNFIDNLNDIDRKFMGDTAVRINSRGGIFIESPYAIDALNNCVNCDDRIKPFLEAIRQEEYKLEEEISSKSDASKCDIDSLFGIQCKEISFPEDSEKISCDVKVFDMSMTSRQIAEATGKEHFHIVRDVKKMIKQGDIGASNFGYTPYVHDQNGQTYQEYILDFDATMLLITGYDASRRKAVITRWRELEQGKAKPIYETRIPTQIELARQVVELLESNEKKDNLINGFIESQKYHTAQGIGRVLVESGTRGSQVIVMAAARNMGMVFKNNFGKNIPTERSIKNDLMADTNEQQTPRFTKNGTKKIIEYFTE